MPDPAAAPRHEPFTFARPVIVRLRTKGGRVYELAQRWEDPVDDQTTFAVSFILEREEERETTIDEDEESAVEEEVTVSAHHYEVWAVSDKFMGLIYELAVAALADKEVRPDFAQRFAEVADRVPGSRVREVLASEVEYVEREVRNLGEVLPEIGEHFSEAIGVQIEIPTTGQPQPQPRQPAAPPPNGG